MANGGKESESAPRVSQVRAEAFVRGGTRRRLPSGVRVSFFLCTSKASSKTRFMYSSKPWAGRKTRRRGKVSG